MTSFFHLNISDFEASFIRLLDKLTNGSNIVVNETGKHRISLSFCGKVLIYLKKIG